MRRTETTTAGTEVTGTEESEEETDEETEESDEESEEESEESDEEDDEEDGRDWLHHEREKPSALPPKRRILYIQMEYCKRTLDDLLALGRDDSLPEEQACPM